MGTARSAIYDDGGVACYEEALMIRGYYPWGAKQIPYASIKDIRTLPLTGFGTVRRWRIWGSDDFTHWWNLDLSRPNKRVALVIDLGRRVQPTITPNDAAEVECVIRDHLRRHRLHLVHGSDEGETRPLPGHSSRASDGNRTRVLSLGS